MPFISLNISSYGAAGDGTYDDTAAFEQAIELIKQHGGGRLIVSNFGHHHHHATRYLIRPINLTSHFILYLQANVSIVAMDDPSVWPIIPALPSYGQGRDYAAHSPRYTSLLHGVNLTNVTIQGNFNSIIDGKGSSWWQRHHNHSLEYTRGHLIEFMYSSNIVLHDVHLYNSPFWTNHFYDCDNVHVNNVHIVAPLDSPNTDGWDPDSSRNVLIENSSYRGGDDCVAIKSGWDCFGLQYNKPSVNITIRNVTCHGKFASIAIGSEMSGGVDNVLVENVIFTLSNKPVNIKVGNTRGGYVRNIMYHDIIVNGIIKQAVHIDTFHYKDAPNPSCPANYRPPNLPIIENISLININGSNATIIGNEVFHLQSYPVSPIQGLFMQDVYFNAPNADSKNITAWNCTGVMGTIVNGTVSPWPPCHNLQVINMSRTLNSQKNVCRAINFWNVLSFQYTKEVNSNCQYYYLLGYAIFFAMIAIQFTCSSKYSTKR